MPARALGALVLASALITFDGTAVTIALPGIGRDLGLTFTALQWIGNGPLLMLAALLVPAGALADRYGRGRLLRLGLVAFGVASMVCASAPDGRLLITARLIQGAGGALVLPGVVAMLRAAYADPVERTRKFGVWAAWTGVASAAGPLMGGLLVDLFTWRAVFVASGVLAAVAAMLLWRTAADPAGRIVALPVSATMALILLLGATSYLLIEGRTTFWGAPPVLFAAMLIPASLVVLARSSRREALFPPELLTARNCLRANGATFGLYFGVFGLSFLLAMYTQQALGYSGGWAGASVLPISLMLLLAEPFARLTSRVGTRGLVTAGSIVAGAGVMWVATGPHPLPFWSRIVVGTSVFGLGISMAASALTHAAVSAVPEDCAGAASGLNHAMVRAAGVVSIALLGSLAAEGQPNGVSVRGFQRAAITCGVFVAVFGVAGGAALRDEEPGGLTAANARPT